MACLWIFCIAIGLFSNHDSKASVSLSAEQGKNSGMEVAVPPSRLPARQYHSLSNAPSHSPHIHKRKRWHHGHPSHNQGPSASPAHAPKHSPSPSPIPTDSYVYAPYKPPMQSPSKSIQKHPTSPLPHPVKSLPPPPPNLDCSSTTCTEPLMNTPPGCPCSCVLPMKVGLKVGVALYAFFPLVAELAQEIAVGVSMELSQVRIMGANAASGEPEKTVVLINLVPRGQKFDNVTALMTFEKFWHKKIFIKAPFFGNYDVLSVLYPGLPSSPHAQAQAQGYGYGNNPMVIHPFAADVNKRKEKHGSNLLALIVLSSITTLVLCTGIALALYLRHRLHTRDNLSVSHTSSPPYAKSSTVGFSRFVSKISSGSISRRSNISAHIGSVKSFGLFEIENATNNFEDSGVIGEGGFGLVYKGVLESGIPVAVKVLKRDDQQGIREFLAEVEILSRLHHKNLVKLLGICTEGYMHCLIYELVPNGSVESHLYGAEKESSPLDWDYRMKIALGAARCLAYLHEDTNPHVIHRDFKSSNILLDHDYTPKLCDFGLARTAVLQENEHISTRVMGTFGYVAPEYAMTGHLLVKSDVYSYGVVLLELLTGRKPVDMQRPPGQENLVTWARPLLTCQEGLHTLIDPKLKGCEVPFDSIAKVAAIASMCVQPEVSQRPYMGEVVQALKLVCGHENYEDHMEVCEVGSGVNLEEDTVLERYGMFSGSSSNVEDFRRYPSSGPLRTGKGKQFLEWARGLSGGSVSDHEIRRKFGDESV